MRTILKQLGKYKRDSILTLCYAGLEAVMEVILPFTTALIIDKGLQAGDMGAVFRYGLLMIVMALCSLTCGILAGKYAASASAGFACNLRQNMYERIQDFSFSNIDKFSTAGLVTRMTTDITNVQNAFQMSIRIAIRAPLMLVFSMVMCFWINRTLSLIFLVALCFLAVMLFFLLGGASKVFRQVFDKYDDLNEDVQENVSAIRVVKAYVREDFENKKFTKATQNLYRLFVKAESLLALNAPSMMLVIYGCITAVSWFGAKFIVAGDMTTGQITSLFSYIMGVMMSLMMLSMIFVMVSMSSASVKRISEVLNEVPELRNPEEPVMELADGSIDFDHVDFSYQKGSGEEVLKDIDLHIKSGETIGIVGGTGSGKTSLVNLISRLYDATEGEVRVGGRNVKDYDLEALRNQVAVVLQKNVVFSGTILENLRWGKEDATEEECVEACRAACADEFIEKMPKKYETYLERGGANVSGGQKQRLCIARALLKQPKVLILDDSTSAVDTATDARIRKAFREKIPGTTKLIIAQRVSSVEDADRILILDDGHILGFDTHENLLKNNAIYREIYESQIKGGGDFDQAG
ncbi:ABC transporter ATP-binding protein [Zhenpiania hominis]|uniref:ABC transporter ATP-binding protein n=3 Tax=Zhenpiania hominis TaxID=2763644 RepID=A0A923SX55_9FIRM|nr:ABC transporter ATP-binding protein [Zhenpiania hominis]MBC6680998.1 ABC transporter ATP-binding protein [Zhenpiania hominis]